MAVSKAQQAAVARYMKKNYDEMKIRVKKGKRQMIEAVAQSSDESINSYVKKAVQAKYKADTGKEIEL